MAFRPATLLKRDSERVITWSRFAGMKFCPALPRSRQYSKLFINFILWLHGKSFIPARRDPAFVPPGSRFAGTKFSHVIVSARLSATKNLISIEYISIDRRYFYRVFTKYMTSICEKKIIKCLIEFHYFTEAATEGVLQRRCS